MKKLLLASLITILSVASLTAQSKKELQAEVDRLESELAAKDEEILSAKKKESISMAEAEQYKGQVDELKAANATLLSNLKTFTEASQQRSESIGQTLESLRRKEAQLKTINDQFSANDSIALLVLTAFKQTLGENALVGVKEGAVVVELSTPMLFGDSPGSTAISEDGQLFLDKIATVAKTYPDTELSVHTQLTAEGDTQPTKLRGLSILSGMEKSMTGETGRLRLAFAVGSAPSYEVRIYPKLRDFYFKVRETVKKK